MNYEKFQHINYTFMLTAGTRAEPAHEQTMQMYCNLLVD